MGEIWPTVVAVVAALSGMVLGWSGRAREVKRATQEAEDKAAQAASCEAQADTMLKVDIEYIKRAVDDIRIDQRAQRDLLGTHDQRITRVEESAKQAHKRIDEIAGRPAGRE